jgi:aspartyl-tRNA(Asn)/glutamyl-tRNA(Gln) amidotransferase subunit A
MFGWKGVTDSPVTGITTNPYDFSKTAGGSSGGCSASVGLGMGSLSMGTDGGGSVRIPAAFCGISTIKPTHSLVAHCISRFGTLATT